MCFFQIKKDTGFYAEAVAGTLINVLQNKETYDREAVTRDMVLIFKASIPNILLSRNGQPQPPV